MTVLDLEDPGLTMRTIGSLGAWVGGGTPSKVRADYWTNGDIPWVSPKDMKTARITNTEDHITSAAVEFSNARIVPPDSLLLVVRSGILSHSLPLATTARGVAINQDIKALIPHSGIDAEYVRLLLAESAEEILSRCSKAGITVASIDMDRFLRLKVPVPGIKEQKRIVALFRHLMAKIDEIKSDLANVLTLSARFRQAIIDAAYTGNIASRNGAKSRRRAIKELILSLDQGWSPKCEAAATRDPNVWAVMTTTAIQSLDFDPYQNKKLPKSLSPRQGLTVEPSDVLITRAGPRSRVGISCAVGETKSKLILCDKAYRLRVNKDLIVPQFLAIALNSSESLGEIERMKSGISDSGLNLTQQKIANLCVPVPPLETQKEIVAAVLHALSVNSQQHDSAVTSLVLLRRLERSMLRALLCSPQIAHSVELLGA